MAQIKLGLLALFAPSIVSAAIARTAYPPDGQSVRLPPYMDPACSSSPTPWLAPPDSFYVGTWYITNTSRAEYRRFPNLQWDLSTVIPTCKENSTSSCGPGTVAGVISDVSSWTLNVGNSTRGPNVGALGAGGRPLASTFGWDTPIRLDKPELGPEWDGVFHYTIDSGKPNGYIESWALTYWGVDAKGFPFMLIHEDISTVNGTQTNPPCLDVLSRSPEGPDPMSLAEVLHATEELGNEELTKLVKDVEAVEWDHGLQGPPAICNTRCQTNGDEA